MGIYGILSGHLEGGLFSFLMVVVLRYAHREMQRDETESNADPDKTRDDQTIF